MKILFFVATFPCISETFVLNQVTGLLDKGHDVRIFSWGMPDTSKPHEDYERYNLNKRVVYLNRRISHNKALRLFRIFPFVFDSLLKRRYNITVLLSNRFGKLAVNLTLLYIAESLKQLKWKPDAIISHFGDNGLIISAMKEAGIIEQRTKHYVFFHAHELCRMDIKELADFYKPLFNSNDTILPISDFWRVKLQKSGANPDNLKVFHMGIDSSKFTLHHPKTIGDKMNILSVGRLVGQKGYEYSLKAVAKFVNESSVDVMYTIIGCGPLEFKLKKMAERYGISDKVWFKGAQNQAVVLEYLANTDVFLLPSVIDSEGYMEGIPVALMEAMAMGKICISTYHSGIPELIENNTNGLLCEEKNPDDIATALNQVKSMSLDELEQMSEAARNTVVNHYNIKRLVNQLECLLLSD